MKKSYNWNKNNTFSKVKIRAIKILANKLLKEYSLTGVEFKLFPFSTRHNRKWIKDNFGNPEYLLSCQAFYCGYYSMICADLDILEYKSLTYVKKLLLHEIAHVIIGEEHQHDKKWESFCESIGGFTDRLFKKYAKESTIIG